MSVALPNEVLYFNMDHPLGRWRARYQVSQEELERRRDEWLPPKPTPERGWLSVYQQVVQPLSMGAVLGPRD